MQIRAASNLLPLFHLVRFIKCWQVFLELNSKTVLKLKEKKSPSCVYFLHKMYNGALSHHSGTVTAKKCTKKKLHVTAKMLFC